MKIQALWMTGTLTALAMTAGCVEHETVYRDSPPPQREVYVEPAPAPEPRVVYVEAPPERVVYQVEQPAPVVEVITVRPGPGFVWIGGSWSHEHHDDDHGRGHNGKGRDSWGWHKGHWSK